MFLYNFFSFDSKLINESLFEEIDQLQTDLNNQKRESSSYDDHLKCARQISKLANDIEIAERMGISIDPDRLKNLNEMLIQHKENFDLGLALLESGDPNPTTASSAEEEECFFSVSLFLDRVYHAVYPIFSSVSDIESARMAQKKLFRYCTVQTLNQWCLEEGGGNRVGAKQIILKYLNGQTTNSQELNSLDLSFLHLTTLPDIFNDPIFSDLKDLTNKPEVVLDPTIEYKTVDTTFKFTDNFEPKKNGGFIYIAAKVTVENDEKVFLYARAVNNYATAHTSSLF